MSQLPFGRTSEGVLRCWEEQQLAQRTREIFNADSCDQLPIEPLEISCELGSPGPCSQSSKEGVDFSLEAANSLPFSTD